MLVFLVFILLGLALLGLFTNLRRAEEAATIMAGAAFLLSLSAFVLPVEQALAAGLNQGREAFLFASVICFISLAIQAYSLRHLDGHRWKRRTFRYFVALTISLLAFALADNILLLAVALGMSNFLLSRLVGHQQNWAAARASGRMAWRQLGLGSALLALAVGILYFSQERLSLRGLAESPIENPWLPIVASLLILSAMAQSAIWPLHRWLIASANAPTPVSAFMHAGLVNGGALILYKFSPILRQAEWSGTALVIAGATTAILGTTWMLVQTDVKRTLTCSTMGQMGFMILQCGLGLFPAAIAHMIWHGFFKASLFLSAGSTVKAAKNQSLRLEGSNTLPIFGFGILVGLGGALIFRQFTPDIGSLDSTYLLLLIFCGITCAHAVMAILQPRLSLGRAALAAALGLFGASVYGASVWLVESQLAPLSAPPLNTLHLAILAIFIIGWLAMIFRAYLPGLPGERLMASLYVRVLRDSQPEPTTLSLQRGQYHF